MMIAGAMVMPGEEVLRRTQHQGIARQRLSGTGR